MALKFGAAAGALFILIGAAPSAPTGSRLEQIERRAKFQRPAAIPFPERNPYSAAKAELGRTLFFDPILSGARDRSCASCHDPQLAWGNGRARALRGDGGDMALRSPTLLNIAWADGKLGCDGKFEDLESVAFAPITGPANMNLAEQEAIGRLAGDPAYLRAFAEAFPSGAENSGANDSGANNAGTANEPAVSRARIENALATFQRLIVSEPSSFDRWVAGEEAAIGTAAKRGFDLFTGKANCAACHEGWTFTDGSFHDIGTARDEDIGRGRLFPNSVALRYAFKTPTLRDVGKRAPYMHDGSVATLAAVIELYDKGGIDRPSRSREIRPLDLTPAEKSDLLAFLRTLDEPVPVPPSTASTDPPRP